LKLYGQGAPGSATVHLLAQRQVGFEVVFMTGASVASSGKIWRIPHIPRQRPMKELSPKATVFADWLPLKV
jgi:hypothetical protein